MVKKIFFFTLLFFNYPNILSQEIDTISVKQNIKESKKLTQSNPEKAIEIAIKAKIDALKINYIKGVIKSNIRLGIINFYKGNHQKSILYYQENIGIAKKEHDYELIGLLYFNIATSYYNIGNYNESTKSCFLALKYLKNRAGVIVSVHHQLAINYNILKLHDKAVDILIKSIEIVENTSVEKLKEPKKEIIAILHSELGRTYFDKGDLKNAIYSFKLAEEQITSSSNSYSKYGFNLYLSEYYLKIDSIEIALKYAIKAKKIAERNSLDNVKPHIFKIIGDIYLKKNNLIKAKFFLLEAKKQLATIDNKDVEVNLYKSLSKLYAKLKTYKKAYNYSDIFLKLNDSIIREENVRIHSNITASYEAEKKDNKINIQRLRIKSQENLLLRNKQQQFMYISIVIVLIVILLIILMRYWFKQKLKHEELERLKIKNNLEKLDFFIKGEEKERSRLAQDLHDGINGDLSVIKLLISTISLKNMSLKENDVMSQVIENIDGSIEQVRTISYNLAPPTLQHFGLMKSLKDYCKKVFYLSNITLNFYQFGEYLKSKSNRETAIYRIVQEIITNIIKHSEAKNTIVQITCTDTNLNIIIEDDGVGYDVKKEKEGLGLGNIKSRIDFLEGSLEIKSNAEGSCFTFDVPMGDHTD